MVDLGKVSVSVGVGVVDEVLQFADAKATIPRTGSFKTWQDWGRLGLAVIGYLGPSFMPKHTSLFDTIATAVTPLVVKTLAVPLKSAMGIAGAVGSPTWVPTRVPLPARNVPVGMHAGMHAAWKPAPISAGG